jgi:hypothetical protein
MAKIDDVMKRSEDSMLALREGLDTCENDGRCLYICTRATTENEQFLTLRNGAGMETANYIHVIKSH